MLVVKTVCAFLFVAAGALLTFGAEDKFDRIYGMLCCMFAYLICMSMRREMIELEVIEYIAEMVILIYLTKMIADKIG